MHNNEQNDKTWTRRNRKSLHFFTSSKINKEIRRNQRRIADDVSDDAWLWLAKLNVGLRPKLSRLVSVFGLGERLIQKVKWPDASRYTAAMGHNLPVFGLLPRGLRRRAVWDTRVRHVRVLCRNRYRYGHGCNGMRIGNRIQAFEPFSITDLEWSLNQDFNITPLVGAKYLRNGTS